jgi:hypothetical protein
MCSRVYAHTSIKSWRHVAADNILPDIAVNVTATNRSPDESRTTASALRLSCYIVDDVTRPNTAYWI